METTKTVWAFAYNLKEGMHSLCRGPCQTQHQLLTGNLDISFNTGTWLNLFAILAMFGEGGLDFDVSV